jgi:hypothetical protein
VLGGGSYGSGFWRGAITGGISGGIMGGIGHLRMGNFIEGTIDSGEGLSITGPERDPTEVAKKAFGDDIISITGNPVFKKGSEMPSEGIGKYSYDTESKFIIDTDKHIYGGLTNRLGGATTIYISNARLAGDIRLLTSTIGHELIYP